MELYVMRHGQISNNIRKEMVGCRQIYSLTEEGKKQAIFARSDVEMIDYDFIICSPLKRAKQTCELVNIKNKKVIYDNRIMARDCGEIEGKPKDSFDYLHYWNYYYDYDIKGMISMKDFVNTVWSFVDDIKEKYPSKKILLITHNGVCRAIGAYFYGIPKNGDMTTIYAQDNCKIIKYHVE